MSSRSPVIVTGAGGFVGSHLVRALLNSGRRVVATDIATTFPSERIAGVANSEMLSYVSGDLLQDTTLEELAAAAGGRADVVHVAARINFGQLSQSLDGSTPSPSAALQSFAVNADVTWRLCLHLAGDDLLGRFVHVSTRSVFGGLQTTAGHIDETTPWQPAGIYGSSKAAAEIGLLAFRDQFGLDLAVARITGVFGPWQGPVSFIGQAIDAVISGRPYRASTGGDDAYELTYVKDTVRGVVALLHAATLKYSIYHIASGDRLVKLNEVAAAIRASDAAADVDFGPGSHKGAGGRTPLAIGRAAAEFGFATRWSLIDAIADYLRVERSGSYGAEAADEPRLPSH